MPKTAMPAAIVTDRWDPEGGGRERYVADLAAALGLAGHSVTVICLHAGAGAPPDQHLGPALDVVGSVAPERSLERSVRAWRARHPGSPVLTTRPACGATHYQLHSGLYRLAYEAERRSYGSAVRRALFWPALHLGRRRARLLATERRMFTGQAPPQAMVFTTRERDELTRQFGVDGCRVTVQPPGTDLTVFQPCRHHSPQPKPQVLFAGHNFRLKGLRWAVDAVAAVRRSGLDVRLVVAGRGPAAPYRRFVRLAGIDDAVTFAGCVGRAELVQLFHASDALVLPTFFDPWGHVVVESLACGCPVVVTRACGAAEIIEPGRHGYVVDDPRDVASLARAIESVCRARGRETLRQQCAALGRRFDFDSHVRRVADWLGLTVSSQAR
jgi:UDP-glucose:(heptosyl)LPS alpha-1,3-glucosyltransferase